MSCLYCYSEPHANRCPMRADLTGFTPGEIADLNRIRNHPDPLDQVPMGYINGEAVPWLTAINLDPRIHGLPMDNR